MSRSEFFAQAARHYLDTLDRHPVTRQIDDALATVDGSDEAAEAAVAAGRQRLSAIDGEW